MPEHAVDQQFDPRDYEISKLRKEMVEIMRRCSSEIKQMRSVIDQLAPRAEAYDNLAALIRMFPRASQGAGEDLAWSLDRRIKQLSEPSAE